MNDRKITIELTKDEYLDFMALLGRVKGNPRGITWEQRMFTDKIHKAVRVEVIER